MTTQHRILPAALYAGHAAVLLAIVLALTQPGGPPGEPGVASIVDTHTGTVSSMRDASSGGVLIHARNGLFRLHVTNGAVAVDPIRISDAAGFLHDMRDIPGA